MATTDDSTSPTNAIDGTPTANPSVESADPFASQREGGEDPFAADKGNDTAITDDGGESPTLEGNKARRMSKEWDASKVPPSQFQKRKGSIYAVPSSRDSHSQNNERDKAYFEKIKEKGWNVLKKK